MLNNYWKTYTDAAFFNFGTGFKVNFTSIEKYYMEAKRHIKRIKNSATQRATPDISAANLPPVHPNTDVKLSRIEIPKLSGTLTTWTQFYDLFNSLVHNAVHLNNFQKMHYLRSSVKGEGEQLMRSYKVTEQLIRSYKVTDANYTAAWDALRARYNNNQLAKMFC